jgi:hypothetical protein
VEAGLCEAAYSFNCIDVYIHIDVFLYRMTILFIFINGLFNDGVSNVRLHSVERSIISELETIWKEAVVARLEEFFCRG